MHIRSPQRPNHAIWPFIKNNKDLHSCTKQNINMSSKKYEESGYDLIISY